MANYCCAIRTNYFHVKDENTFLNLMQIISVNENTIHVFEDTDSEGKKIFAFGAYGSIVGICNGENDAPSYVAFIVALQDIIAEDDAIIIFESGNEKLRYLVGSAEIITSSSFNHIDIKDQAMKKAQSILKNKKWNTRCSY